MFGRAKVLLTIASSALAMPVVAQAPTPTAAFDGKYVGVSIETLRPTAHPGAKCDPPGLPAPLTIKDGVISGSWEGTVSPQGGLVARDGTGRRINGQMQNDGTMRALYSGAVCSFNFVWRKQP